jgi:phytoene/squalene synthetase
MGNAQVYLKYSVECERMARELNSDETRTALLAIARAWRNCADEEKKDGHQELKGRAQVEHLRGHTS